MTRPTLTLTTASGVIIEVNPHDLPFATLTRISDHHRRYPAIADDIKDIVANRRKNYPNELNGDTINHLTYANDIKSKQYQALLVELEEGNTVGQALCLHTNKADARHWLVAATNQPNNLHIIRAFKTKAEADYELERLIKNNTLPRDKITVINRASTALRTINPTNPFDTPTTITYNSGGV